MDDDQTGEQYDGAAGDERVKLTRRESLRKVGALGIAGGVGALVGGSAVHVVGHGGDIGGLAGTAGGRLTGDLTVQVDDIVGFHYTVTNEGDESVELSFPNALMADVAVIDGNREVWRFSDGRMFAQMIRTETLDPGDKLVNPLVWESPEDGTYTAVATLAAREDSVEARQEFTV